MAPLLLHLDRYHLGDVFFLQNLAGALAQGARRRPPCILVHGSGEQAERALEAEGYDARRRDGVLHAPDGPERDLVARSMRTTNRKVVALLTDQLVPAVGFHAMDRGLIRRSGGGVLETSDLGWLDELAGRGAVPVVSTLGEREGGTIGELPEAEVLEALVRGFGGKRPAVAVFTKTGLPGLMDGGQPRPACPMDALPGPDVVPEPEIVRRLVARGGEVLLTNPARGVGSGAPAGTWIRASVAEK